MSKSLNVQVVIFSILLLKLFSFNNISTAGELGHPESTTSKITNRPNSGLITGADIENSFVGAFRIPKGTYGNSKINYAMGKIAFNPDNNSLFIVGHTHHQSIAEFVIPDIVKSDSIGDLRMAQPPVQGFAPILNRTISGNPQKIDRISGMLYLDGKLIVNAFEYYDAAANNSHTTLVVENAKDIESSMIKGFYSIKGAAHASGWMSPIPKEWKDSLGGEWITGFSSGWPIISRLSVGPSAFIFNPKKIGVIDPLPAIPLLDFNLKKPLSDDLFNKSLENKLWTHKSRASYGIILPDTSTYLTIGSSGGHNSGICYKCKPIGKSSNCFGYCAHDVNDYSLYYWLWDVNDLVDVNKKNLAPYQLRPYEYGRLSTPFPSRGIGGAAFDPDSRRLYVSLLGVDIKQSKYGPPPLILVYEF